MHALTQLNKHAETRFNVSLKLSSREVEGNGPMKPGNPPALPGRVPIPAEYTAR